jgi:hypothetical protein
MRSLLLFCILVLTSLIGYSQSDSTKGCSILKQGTFKYLDIEDTTAYFTINKEKHTEYHSNGKYYIKSKVRWISECQYEMIMQENTIPDFPFGPGEKLLTTIHKVEGNTVYYTSEAKGLKWDGRLVKVDPGKQTSVLSKGM